MEKVARCVDLVMISDLGWDLLTLDVIFLLRVSERVVPSVIVRFFVTTFRVSFSYL